MSKTYTSYDDVDKAAIKADYDSQLDAAKKETGGIYDQAIANNNNTLNDLQADIEANKDAMQKAQEESHKATVDAIEQNKEWANKDYIKEQSGAYTDWMKQSNQYGVDAEQKAANGLTNTGFSESSQVSMYNQYQNRIATARESYQRAVTEYNLAIAEARAQNSVALAEIASQALAQALEVTVTFATQNNTLLTQKAEALATLDQNYYTRYLAELDQINKEIAYAESVRQHNEQMAFEREKFNWTKEQAEKTVPASSVVDSSGRINKDGKDALSNNSGSIDKNSGDDNSDLTVNMASVTALGYGPISAERLNDLVASGEVIEYEVDGQLYYKKSIGGENSIAAMHGLPTAQGKKTNTNGGNMAVGSIDPINGKTIKSKNSTYVYYTDGSKRRYR